MTDLNKRVALITGGSKGIGYGIAEALLGEGIAVAITGRHQDSLNQAVKTLQSTAKDGAKIIGIQADARQFDDQQNAVATTVEKFGKLDILIANAGQGHFAPIDELSLEQWHQTIDTNLTGPFYSLKAAMAQLKANKGYFMTISSLAGTNFFKGASAYNASKFGITGFTQAAMLDMREYGIKTTTIMPGSVATHFNNHTPSEADDWKIQKEDLGEIVVDLLKMNARTLPSKIEVRPSFPPSK